METENKYETINRLLDDSFELLVTLMGRRGATAWLLGALSTLVSIEDAQLVRKVVQDKVEANEARNQAL